jgi:hypothetical protein
MIQHRKNVSGMTPGKFKGVNCQLSINMRCIPVIFKLVQLQNTFAFSALMDTGYSILLEGWVGIWQPNI